MVWRVILTPKRLKAKTTPTIIANARNEVELRLLSIFIFSFSCLIVAVFKDCPFE